MKKIVSLFVVLVILFNTIGNLIVLKGMQYSIRKEIKSSIANFSTTNNKLITIIVNSKAKNTLRFTDDDEFIYNENIYDIVKKEIVGDSIKYYCFNDSKEELLFANLDKEVENNMNTNPVKSKTQQLLKKISISLFYENNISTHFINSNDFVYPSIKKLSVNTDCEVITPPPKSIV